MSDLAYIPSVGSGFAEMSRTPKGRLFKKQILKYESFVHPNDPKKRLVVDEAFADKLIQNFTNGVCDIVQVPVVDGKNAHVEDPDRNIGEVVDVTKGPDGIYATIDVRKDGAAEQLGKTYLGASAMLHLDYTDTRTGEKVGPTLLHTAVTNRPYITNLKDYEEIVAASADTFGERPSVLIAEEKAMPTKEELIAQLRDEHKVDVEALQTELSAAQAQVAATPQFDESTLVQAFSSALQQAGAVSLTQKDEKGQEVTLTDVAEAVIEVANEKVELAGRVETLETELVAAQKREVEKEVDELIKAGRILPKAKDAMVKLASTDRESFEAIVPEDAIVALGEEGVTTHQEPGSVIELSDEQKADIERLHEVAKGLRK